MIIVIICKKILQNSFGKIFPNQVSYNIKNVLLEKMSFVVPSSSAHISEGVTLASFKSIELFRIETCIII